MNMEQLGNEQNNFSFESLQDVECISWLDVRNIVLVQQGLKPTTYVEMGYHGDSGDYTREDFSHDVALLESTLSNLGLVYEKELFQDEYGDYEIFYVARDDINLGALLHANEVLEGPERDRALGGLYGIPETAVEAFINKTTIPIDELPSEVAKELGFLPSRDHWQDELEEIKARNDLARKAVPELPI